MEDLNETLKHYGWWICFWLFCITMNTCDMARDIKEKVAEPEKPKVVIGGAK